MTKSRLGEWLGRGLYLGLISASASASTGVFAQGALEEVVVSATRRAESIQDVPISVAAVSGDTIQDPCSWGISCFLQISGSTF